MGVTRGHQRTSMRIGATGASCPRMVTAVLLLSS